MIRLACGLMLTPAVKAPTLLPSALPPLGTSTDGQFVTDGVEQVLIDADGLIVDTSGTVSLDLQVALQERSSGRP